MKRFLRPAFVVTGWIAAVGCTEPPTTPPPDGNNTDQTTRNPPGPRDTTTPTTTATTAGTPKKLGVHPRDAENRLIQRKKEATCYVQVDKKGPPPKDLMSGERWVEDKVVPCPKEYDEPAFAAIPPGNIWVQDAQTGECSHEPLYGNPPPPATKAECPPSLKIKK